MFENLQFNKTDQVHNEFSPLSALLLTLRPPMFAFKVIFLIHTNSFDLLK